MKDYYQILGIPQNAELNEIKAAYRELAKRYHPDRNPLNAAQAETKFKEMKEAYEVLSDPLKRREYDQSFAMGAALPLDIQDPGEILNSVLRGFPGQTAAAPTAGNRKLKAKHGEDIYVKLEIPFSIAMEGGKSNLSLEKEVICPECEGSGLGSGGKKKLCSFCDGIGEIQELRGKHNDCPRCLGKGYLIDIPCAICGGFGIVQKLCKWGIHIPAGIEDGQKLRLAGDGQPGRNGGPAGDLVIQITIDKRPDFVQEGNNIVSECCLNIAEAILGTTVTVSTVKGDVALEIPPGTQPGTSFKIPEHGITQGDVVGDHIVRIQVQIPQNITRRQQELLQEFMAAGQEE